MNTTQKNLIYLLSCSVNGIVPDKESVDSMDLEKLYQLAKFHSVASTVCMSLEDAGIKHEKFHEAMKKSVRKNIFLDIELKAISDEFEKQGIWYMPLKGAILKDIYPKNGMRQMADNDVLFDAEKREQVREIMISKGYTVERFNESNHDIYHKQPVLNFEMHTALFEERHSKVLVDYYSDIKRLLLRDSDNNYGYHFSDEDFYVFMTAHEWKHYSNGGTGIRSLLDCYVYCKNKGAALDWNYINDQCKQLEIAGFEKERRQLADKVFSSDKLPSLNERESEILEYYLTAGTYGTVEKSVKNKLKKQSKAEYILKNMFPNVSYMKNSVKFVKKYPILYPVGIVYRWGRILIKRRKLLFSITKVLKDKE